MIPFVLRCQTAVGLAVLFVAFSTPAHAVSATEQADGAAVASSAQRLLAAYPEQLCAVHGNSLFWCDGTEMPIDDGIVGKSFQQLLDQPDLEDQFRFSYQTGRNYQVPPERNHDPGRIRYEPFLKKMYGATQKAVQRNLVPMQWPFSPDQPTFMVTKVNGVNKEMAAVIEELKALSDEMKRYLKYFSGTFNWRVIKGTDRYSPHSFGVAIDLGGPWSDYWLWAATAATKEPVYRNRIPLEIVLIFEKHGFIWGGKWYHYDTMHFEYRPELLNQ